MSPHGSAIVQASEASTLAPAMDYPVAMVRRSIKRVAGGADIIRIKFFWLLSPELRWLGQPGNGNLTVCGVMVDVLSKQLVSGSV
jgi:hypothetical protein